MEMGYNCLEIFNQCNYVLIQVKMVPSNANKDSASYPWRLKGMIQASWKRKRTIMLSINKIKLSRSKRPRSLRESKSRGSRRMRRSCFCLGNHCLPTFCISKRENQSFLANIQGLPWLSWQSWLQRTGRMKTMTAKQII